MQILIAEALLWCLVCTKLLIFNFVGANAHGATKAGAGGSLDWAHGDEPAYIRCTDGCKTVSNRRLHLETEWHDTEDSC